MSSSSPPHNSSSSSHFHSSSNSSHNPSPTTPRPKPFTATTVIPTLPSTPYQPTLTTTPTAQANRSRSKTSSTRQFVSPASRPRAGTTPQGHPSPIDVNLAALSFNPSVLPRLASSPAIPSDKPSSPIPIPVPQRQRDPSPPITPLTARARSPMKFFGTSQPRSQLSESLTPYYTAHPRKVSPRPSQTASAASSVPGASVVQRGFIVAGPRNGSPHRVYRPTSPLSPTKPMQSLSGASPPTESRPPKNMTLPGLPRFHPANFQSRDTPPVPHSPRSSRSITSQPRANRGSDAQQKLHQYQRDLIANATQSSRSLLSDSLSTKPDSPRLTPLRSPIDPMTPLALEAQGDYLLAGSSIGGTPASSFKEGDGRDMVERLVQRENERRNHPEARSGSVSPALSPAISPAVSPAGGRG